MLQVILGLAVVLILFVFVLLYRVQSLVTVLKGSDDEVGTASNKINALMFLFFLISMGGLFFWYSFARADVYIMPEASSLHGIETDKLFWLTMVIIIAAFLLTNALLFIFAFRYQYKKDRKVAFFPEHHMLELVWTIVPAVVLTFLVFKGFKVWTDTTTVPTQFYAESGEYIDAGDNGLLIEVMAQQFAWNVRYPGADGKLGKHNFRLIDPVNGYGLDLNDENTYDDLTPTKIVLPVNVPVLFKIRSRDVLHSVYAPHFRVKMDAVPGMPTTFFFTPTVTTAEMRTKLYKRKCLKKKTLLMSRKYLTRLIQNQILFHLRRLKNILLL